MRTDGARRRAVRETMTLSLSLPTQATTPAARSMPACEEDLVVARVPHHDRHVAELPERLLRVLDRRRHDHDGALRCGPARRRRASAEDVPPHTMW